MPIPLSYQSLPARIQFETDPDGALHISIPPQASGLAGRNRAGWAAFLIAPVCLIAVAACVFHDLHTVELATISGCLIALLGIPFFWLADRKFKRRVWIDATSDELTIRIQRNGFCDACSFSAQRLTAIDVVRDWNDSASHDVWLLRVRGPYEWVSLLNHLSRADAEEIASRLRAVLRLAHSPE